MENPIIICIGSVTRYYNEEDTGVYGTRGAIKYFRRESPVPNDHKRPYLWSGVSTHGEE